MFCRVDHAGVSVKDMDKAIAFYGEVLGMEKGLDRVLEGPLAKLINIEGAKARIVHMTLGDSMVELFQFLHPHGRDPIPDETQCDYGITHIGFIVNDFWNLYQRLKDHHVEFLGEPAEVRPGVHVAYFRGAEQEVCEMREIQNA